MRSDGPLILAVVFLGVGLGILIGYGVGHTGFNVTYPFEGSMMHVDLTTTGPGVLGAVVAGVVGALCLVWAFISALISMVAGPSVSRRERVVERVSVVPRDRVSVVPRDEVAGYGEAVVPEPRRHFWSRHSERTNI